MVKSCAWSMRLLLLSLLPVWAWAGDVEVSVQIHSERVREGEPIEAVVCVTREQQMEVDERSFRVGDEPIRAAFTHNSIESSLLILNGRRSEKRVISSYYQIHLPGKKAGRHLLESVSVVVGGKRYSSPSSTYVIYGAETTSDFRLEAIVEGGTPLYPGQKCQFIYRLYFATPIEPTFERLPFFSSDSFRKIGERETSFDYRGGMTVQEVRQEVQATAPGLFEFETATIEGFPYSRDFFGNRSYEKRRVRAESPSVTVQVLPFPEAGKPSFFGGAVGRYMVRSELISSPAPRVGDKVRIRVDILGKGEWSTVHPPLIGLQDSFRGRFRLSDLPPTCEEGVGRRSYILEMRPLDEEIDQIPPVSYAFFDPASGQYGVASSQPISIAVEPAPDWMQEKEEVSVVEPLPAVIAPVEEVVDWRERWDLPPLEEIPGLFRPPLGELVPHMQTMRWTWLLPLCCLLLAVEWYVALRRRRGGKRRSRPVQAQRLLREALRSKGDPDRFFPLLEGALLRQASEKRGAPVETASELSQEGVFGEVRRFLLQIEESRFSSRGEVGVEEVVGEAKRLFDQLSRV